MKINSSTIGMESTRTYVSQTSMSIATTSKNQEKINNAEDTDDFRALLTGGNQKTDGEALYDSMLGLKNKFSGIANTNRVASRDETDTIRSIRQQCISYILKCLFRGRGSHDIKPLDNWPTSTVDQGSSQPVNSYQMKTLYLQESYYFRETENTTFSTTGKVITADGREIDFNLDIEMSRSFEQTMERRLELSQVSFCDPLVINLDGNIAGLSDQKFFFDIDADGTMDSISQLNAGSGYLALDLDDDGIINDGRELFGTKSGNGFADLAIYDNDGNGWIDENDDIWNKLLIWTKNENGEDMLYRLADKGVGAIYLGNVSTQFSVNSSQNNQTNGMIRSTGIFLYENGNVGTVQHLDVAR